MNTLTYGQIVANAHRVGGETQTEATERMSSSVLHANLPGQIGFLNSILASLDKEAAAATRMEEYDRINMQRQRVRYALGLKGAL